jgi:hypothetical protein
MFCGAMFVAAGGNDQVLLPVRDDQEPVLVKPADVSGHVQPSSVKDLLRLDRHPPVAMMMLPPFARISPSGAILTWLQGRGGLSCRGDSCR